MAKLAKTSIMLALLIITQPVTSAFAETITLELSGNGNGSESQVKVQIQSEAHVEQQNTSEVNNEVNIEASTGGNEVSDSTGAETQIQTGDISTQTQIDNNLNTSTINNTNCCEQTDLDISINNNASDSENAVNFSYQSEVNAEVTQTAKVTNQLNGSANTGRNVASGNNGDVQIKTGSINGGVAVDTNANNSSIEIERGGIGEQKIKISGNGSNSINSISVSILNFKDVVVHEYADINNLVFFKLNTGDNKAIGNLGDVIIETGNINFLVDIDNNVNSSGVDLGDCCGIEDPDDPYDPYLPPNDNGSGGNNSGNSSSSNSSSSSSSSNGNGLGSVLGVGGSILPATGTIWTLLMILANILTFLFGLYLRLRSGRSPALKSTTARA
jgi:hypothetical protein